MTQDEFEEQLTASKLKYQNLLKTLEPNAKWNTLEKVIRVLIEDNAKLEEQIICMSYNIPIALDMLARRGSAY